MKQTNQHGNAVFMILIAVALFAALGFVFSQSSRTSTSFLTDEEANAYASQIIAYGNEVRQAVKRLTLRGCSDTEISFENSVVAGYENPNAPSDKSCHVFDVSGGGLQVQTPSTSMLDTSHSAYSGYEQYWYGNIVSVEGLASDCTTTECTELMLHLPHIKQEICDRINELSNIDTVDEVITNFSYAAAHKFVGTYFVHPAAVIGDETGVNALPSGLKKGCVHRSGWAAGGSPYSYFQVLIAR